jgi:hypothetical protein
MCEQEIRAIIASLLVPSLVSLDAEHIPEEVNSGSNEFHRKRSLCKTLGKVNSRDLIQITLLITV